MILIFGGTTEGREAAEAIDVAGELFYYSTKTEGQEVNLANGIHLSGVMDRRAMEEFCINKGIKLIVDAAHPFAEELHSTISCVAKRLKIKVIRYERGFPKVAEGLLDNIIFAKDYIEAISILKGGRYKRVVALSGVNTIAKFKPIWAGEGVEFWFRVLNRESSLKIVDREGFNRERLLFLEQESILDSGAIERINPDLIITKESGSSGYYLEKLELAKRLGVRVLVIKRPPLPEGFVEVYGVNGLRWEIERSVGFYPLKSGFTTGTYAAALAKCAVRYLLIKERYYRGDDFGEFITLPCGERLWVPLCSVEIGSCGVRIGVDGVKGIESDKNVDNVQSVYATAVKDSGDDPDITNGAVIGAEVALIAGNEVKVRGGVGVGVVTLPGLGIEIGQSAINKTPMEMIKSEIKGIQQLLGVNCGVEVIISIPQGEELAKRSFNPKLGIEGGLSIIGTKGIIKPFSKEAFVLSIKRELEVAKALGVEHIVINSGAKSERDVKKLVKEELPPQAFIHYGNYIGDTISMANELGFKRITMGIMVGKAVKLAAGNLNTHSKKVVIDREFVASVAKMCNLEPPRQDFNMARELLEIYNNAEGKLFFNKILELCYSHCKPLFTNGDLEIHLIL